MIYHLVLFKVKGNATEEEIIRFFAGLRELRQIAGVSQVSCGACDKMPYTGYADRSAGYTHALMVVLADWKALEGYDQNSFHAAVKEAVIKPMLDPSAERPILAIDWEDNQIPAEAKSWWNASSAVVLTASLGVLLFAGMRWRSRL